MNPVRANPIPQVDFQELTGLERALSECYVELDAYLEISLQLSEKDESIPQEYLERFEELNTQIEEILSQLKSHPCSPKTRELMNKVQKALDDIDEIHTMQCEPVEK